MKEEKTSNQYVQILSLEPEDLGKEMTPRKEIDANEFGIITKVIYNSDCGLIVSTFKGLIQIYDSMDFNLVWDSSKSLAS